MKILNCECKKIEIIALSHYSINDIANSPERNKLYVLSCNPDGLAKCISFIENANIKTLNIGKELANFIYALEDYKYLHIDVADYLKRLLDTNKIKLNGSGNPILAIYNLGILLEPRLELNATQLMKVFSKSTALIIIWENQSGTLDQLNWPTQTQNYFFNFSDTQLKKLQYAL